MENQRLPINSVVVGIAWLLKRAEMAIGGGVRRITAIGAIPLVYVRNNKMKLVVIGCCTRRYVS